MMNVATVSANGQITVPADVRRALRLAPGDKIAFVTNELGDITVVKPDATALIEAQRAFAGINAVLERHPLGGAHEAGGVHAAIVDIHAEATSEKMAMGQFCDGRASLVAGTHSHVPTADAQVLPNGTAYITDLGMCGDYDSVIGMRKEAAIARFTTKMPTERLGPAGDAATACGCVVETDDKTGLAKAIHPVRLGGRLQEAVPVL